MCSITSNLKLLQFNLQQFEACSIFECCKCSIQGSMPRWEVGESITVQCPCKIRQHVHKKILARLYRAITEFRSGYCRVSSHIVTLHGQFTGDCSKSRSTCTLQVPWPKVLCRCTLKYPCNTSSIEPHIESCTIKIAVWFICIICAQPAMPFSLSLSLLDACMSLGNETR